VIVVIGILAAITITTYNGITQRAKITVMQSDLEQGVKQLEAYKFGTSTSEQYPVDQATANFKASSGNILNYQVNNNTAPPSYCLTAVNGSLSYWVSNTSTAPTVGTCTGVLASGASCPTSFIVVPGSSTFGTSEFCVMKYEAKQASATVPISQTSGAPWVNISQTNAITYSANVVGCTGCHLVSEPEWLTLAQNVLSVASNWSGGAVGSGYIYSGHNDNSPVAALVADTNDGNGYGGTGNSATSSQRRTLTLTNGEVIWDLAGNVQEWTNAQVNTGQPGLSGYAFREWTAVTGTGTVSPSPFPGAVAAAGGSWNSAQGIGGLYSNSVDTTLRGFFRGGYWASSSVAGVLSLGLNFTPSGTDPSIGFRVSR
jgi:Tfp pilus assembly protein PilE